MLLLCPPEEFSMQRMGKDEACQKASDNLWDQLTILKRSFTKIIYCLGGVKALQKVSELQVQPRDSFRMLHPEVES